MVLNPTVALIARPIFHAVVAPVALVASLGTSGILPALVWVALASLVYGSGRGDRVRGSVFFFAIKTVAFAFGALTLWVLLFGAIGALSAVGGAL